METQVLETRGAKFRIVIYDLTSKKSVTLSLKKGSSLEEIKKKVIECFTRPHNN